MARTPRLSSGASATKLEEGSRPILRLLSLSNGGTPQRLIPLREGRSHKTKSVADTPTPKVYLQYCAVVLAGVARSSSTNGAKANARKQAAWNYWTRGNHISISEQSSQSDETQNLARASGL